MKHLKSWCSNLIKHFIHMSHVHGVPYMTIAMRTLVKSILLIILFKMWSYSPCVCFPLFIILCYILKLVLKGRFVWSWSIIHISIFSKFHELFLICYQSRFLSVSKLTLTKQSSFISMWPHQYIWDNILIFYMRQT